MKIANLVKIGRSRRWGGWVESRVTLLEATMLNAAAQVKSVDGTLTAPKAMRIAWMIWLTLLVIPFFLFLYIVGKFSGGEGGPQRSDGTAWFIVATIYMLAVVPTSFFWR